MCLTGRLSVVCKISSLRITKHFTSLGFLIICGYQGIIFIPDEDYFLGRKKALHKLSNLAGAVRTGEPLTKMIFINHNEASDRFASPLSVFNRCSGQEQKQNQKRNFRLEPGTNLSLRYLWLRIIHYSLASLAHTIETRRGSFPNARLIFLVHNSLLRVGIAAKHRRDEAQDVWKISPRRWLLTISIKWDSCLSH